MKKLLLSTILVLCGYLHADVSANQEVIAATNVVKSFAHDKNFGVSAQYIKNAKAVAILTDVKRLAAGASIQYGDGIFSVKGEDGEWSAPIFIKYRGFGAGIQAGYETSDVVMLFQTTKSYQDIFNGMETLEVNAGATIGEGYRNGAATDLPDISAWMVSPGEQTGVFVGASLDHARIVIDDQLTNDYYGRIYDYEDILNDSPKATKYTRNLKDTLRKYISNAQAYNVGDAKAVAPINTVAKKYQNGKPIVSNRPYNKGARK